MNKVLVYIEQTSPRLKYTFDLLLNDLLGLNYQITHDKDYFSTSPLPRFSYSSLPVGDEIFFEAQTLLFEVVNKPQPINFCAYERIKGFYPVSEQSRIDRKSTRLNSSH